MLWVVDKILSKLCKRQFTSELQSSLWETRTGTGGAPRPQRPGGQQGGARAGVSSRQRVGRGEPPRTALKAETRGGHRLLKPGCGTALTLVPQQLQGHKCHLLKPLSRQKPRALAHSFGFPPLIVPQDNLITGLKTNSVN